VTTLKNTVDHVVTEYGVAKLRGRSIRERTEALIGIAHPAFRDELLVEAKAMGFV
jgi:acyl-CoA hydrolase